MKTIEIKAQEFFDFLKIKDKSMWEIFSQMIDGEKKMLLFFDEKNEVSFQFTLPETLEQLEESRKEFTKIYAEKLKLFN